MSTVQAKALVFYYEPVFLGAPLPLQVGLPFFNKAIFQTVIKTHRPKGVTCQIINVMPLPVLKLDAYFPFFGLHKEIISH